MDSIQIGIFQSILTFLLLALGGWGLFDFPIAHALLIGSIGVASAPVPTLALVKRLNIEETLREMLANIAVVADLLKIVSFAMLLTIAVVLQHGEALLMPHFYECYSAMKKIAIRMRHFLIKYCYENYFFLFINLKQIILKSLF